MSCVDPLQSVVDISLASLPLSLYQYAGNQTIVDMKLQTLPLLVSGTRDVYEKVM